MGVRGVGGIFPITHMGYDERIGPNVAYIEGIPEDSRILVRSIGVWCEQDEQSLEGIVVCMKENAISTRVTQRVSSILNQIIELANYESEGLMVAHKENQVYKSVCSDAALAQSKELHFTETSTPQEAMICLKAFATKYHRPTVELLATCLVGYAAITPVLEDSVFGYVPLDNQVVESTGDCRVVESHCSEGHDLRITEAESLEHMMSSELFVNKDHLNYVSGTRAHLVMVAMCNLYGNRIKFNRRSALLQLLCDSGFSRQTLLDMLDRGTTGIPEGLTRKAIERFYLDVGAGPLQDMANVAKHHRAEKSRDFDPSLKVPGKIYQIDAFEVPFSKAVHPTKHGKIRTVASFNGHKVVALVIDVYTMAATLVSAASFKHPEKAMANMMDQLKSQGHTPAEITADKQFVTPACVSAVKPAILRQSVPGAHDIWTPEVEGAIRWIKEMSLYNYNRAFALVKAGVLSKADCQRLWLYMVRLAIYQWNLRTSSFDKGKTRLEHIENRKFNMFTRVILPFAFQLTAKAITPQQDGNRGVQGLYLLPSFHCDTGFHFFNLITRCVNIVHAFKPDLSLTNRLADADLTPMVRDTLGEMIEQHDENTGVDDLTLTTPGGGEDEDDEYDEEIQTQVVEDVEEEDVLPEPTGQWQRAQKPDTAKSTAKVSSQVKEHLEYARKEALRRAASVVGNSSRDARSAANAIAAELYRLKDVRTSEDEKALIRERIAQRNAERLANVSSGQTIAAAIAVNTPPRISAVERIFRCTTEHAKSQAEMIELFATHGFHIEVAGDFEPPMLWMESVMEAIIKDEEEEPEEPSPLNVPRPPLFKRCDAMSDAWKRADAREISKIMAEATFAELPLDSQGRYIEPLNAIHQRLLRVREWKWKKVHPETNAPGWCACVRIVIDGSKDLRPDLYYALCPDRVLLFLLLALAAASEAELSTSDVERAYLNALAIDRNIVVIASSDLYPIPRRSLLIKALYGARCSAKSWQDWIDNKMVAELGYDKLTICKGIYLKMDDSTGAILHAYRHSDDFLFSSDYSKFKTDEEQGIKSKVRMSAFVPPTKFLGVEITRVDYETGKPNPIGNVMVLRQVGKINEMAAEFAQDIEALFPAEKGVILKTPLPGNHNRPVEELTPMMQTLCTPALITRMMEINGCVLWVASSTRHDLRFAVHWCSTKIVAPIFRDYYMCVHMVQYLIQTKMYPLLLGGPGPVDAYGYSDGSLHTGSKMRSVGSYFVFASALGGAIQSNTFETKYQVLNVMHVELDAITQLANALMYVTHAGQELNSHSPITRRIYTDSEAAQSHCLNNSASKKSKHMELRLQTVQSYQEDDRIDVIHVAGEDNCADQGSKSLDPDTNLRHMVVILGHRMMPGKGIEGVQVYVPTAKHEKVALTQTVKRGNSDVTTDQKACEEFERTVVFMAEVNHEDLLSAVAESRSMGLKANYGESYVTAVESRVNVPIVVESILNDDSPEHARQVEAMQELSALKQEVAAGNFFLLRAQADKRESNRVIERLTTSLAEAISSMEIATEGGEEYVRSQQRIISHIRQITAEYEWAKELERTIISNLVCPQDAGFQLTAASAPQREATPIVCEQDLEGRHKVPAKFGSLFWFRKWLGRYTTYIMEPMVGCEVVGLKDRRVGFRRRNGQLVTFPRIARESVFQLMDVESLAHKEYGHRIPEPDHFAAFQATLRNIDIHHQTGGVSNGCDQTTSLSAR